MKGATLRAAVITRLEAIKPLEKRVQGAAKLAEALERGPQAAAGISAFVVPLGLRGGKADALSGIFRQELDRVVGVVLIVRNVGDSTGDKAMGELDPLIDAVIEQLAGWGPDDAIGVLTLAKGELVSIGAGTITYQLDFAIEDQLRINR